MSMSLLRIFLSILNVTINNILRKQTLKKKWIDKKSVAAYDCTEKIILDPKILKDMVHLVEPYHTGSLEVFHSLINVYATKSQEFDFNTMNDQVEITVLDHNNNVSQKQDVIKKENSQWEERRPQMVFFFQ